MLPFIRRMLMEEDAEDYHPGHPALLQAEQPFAQILSACSTTAATTSTSNAAAATTWPYDPDELSQLLLLSSSRTNAPAVPAAGPADGGVITMDLLNQAFLKGMEEGSKFLPTNSLQQQPIMIFQESSSGSGISGRGCKNRHISWDREDEAEAGRRSKLMAPAEPDDESGEVADGVFNKAYEVALQKMHGLTIAGTSSSSSSGVPGRGPGEDDEEKAAGKGMRQRRSSNEAVDLRTLLIHCAEAVSSGNRISSATELLRQIKRRSSPTGDASQRLAHCFAQGLELRLAGGGGAAAAAINPCDNKRSTSEPAADFLKAYQLYLQVCCFQMAAFKFSHIAICKATAGRSKVHIVDYGEHHGIQWPLLLGHLAAREGGPPEVRITTIGFPQPGFRPAARIDETGRRLTDFARGRGLPLKFRSVVAARWETRSAPPTWTSSPTRCSSSTACSILAG